MISKKRALLAVLIFIMTTALISACTQSLSQAPAATPTLIPTGLFVSPFPSAENPMAMIEQFAQQTAAAQTVTAGGVPATPGTPGTPAAPQDINVTGTVITPEAGLPESPTPDMSTPTNAGGNVLVAATTAVPSGPTSTPVPPGVRPASYTLQPGEFPYCIARRFNVDPDALLRLNGLSSGDIYMPGITLQIPQSGTFPGIRALATHPTTYTVTSSDETVYSVACKFGDIDPAQIAAANSIAVSSRLTAGQQLNIP